jgi:glutaminase
MSLMLSSGLYSFSGEWAFNVGLPAKSGISGCMFVVIPNFGGLAIYSPLVTDEGNSTKAIEFATKLVERLKWHTSEKFMRTEAKKTKQQVMDSFDEIVFILHLFIISIECNIFVVCCCGRQPPPRASDTCFRFGREFRGL